MKQPKTNQCPTEAGLRSYLLGALRGPEADEVGSHLESCESCRKIELRLKSAVTALSQAGDVTALTAPARRRRPGQEPETQTAQPRKRGKERTGGELEPGVRVGRFVLRRELGRGGMGAVYLADDPELNRKVALKFLANVRFDPIWRAHMVRRFRREAQAMAQLSHPNVVQIYDAGEHEGQVFIAMEFVDGTDLAGWLEDDERDCRDIVRVFLAAGAGLQAAHSVGLVHRDFKANNVLISSSGQIKVTDFGLARADDAGDRDEAESRAVAAPTSKGLLDSQLTEVGSLIGTPPYMSPEQIDGEALDARSDVFSFGVALFQALYGRLPFAGADHDELRNAIARGEIRELKSQRGRVPRRVVRAIRRSLRENKADRFSSMAAMTAAIRPRLIAPVVTAVAFAGAVATTIAIVGAASTDDRKDVCKGGSTEMAGVWPGEVRNGIESKLPTPSAAATARLLTSVDRFATDWAAMHDAACTATRIDGSQTERVLELRFACLSEAKAALSATVDRLQQAETSAEAFELVGALPAIRSCGAVERLTHGPGLPDDPNVRRQVEQARAKLARVAIVASTDSRPPALDWSGVSEIKTLAEELSYRPLGAEALAVEGQLYLQSKQGGSAEQSYRKALAIAEELSHDSVRVRAYVGLVASLAIQGRTEDVEELAVIARGVLEKGAEPLAEAQLNQSIGDSLALPGRFDDAEVAYKRSLELLSGAEAEQPLAVARVQLSRGRSFLAAESYDAAFAAFQAAEAPLRELLGPVHVEAIEALRQMGVSRYRAGKASEAIALLERAVEREGQSGNENIDRSDLWLAHALVDAGQPDEAKAHMRPHPVYGYQRREEHYSDLMGSLQSRLGDTDAAEKTYRIALRQAGRSFVEQRGAQTKTVEPEPIVRLTIGLVAAFGRAGEWERALPEARFAVELAQARLDEDSRLLGRTLVSCARVLNELGRYDEAWPLAANADRIYQAPVGGIVSPPPPTTAAEAKLAYARSLWATVRGDGVLNRERKARAVELADEAERTWRLFGGREASRAADARRWLDSRR